MKIKRVLCIVTKIIFVVTQFTLPTYLFAQNTAYFDNWIIAEANRISSRCRTTWCDGQPGSDERLLPGHSPALTRNETLIIFEAAALYASAQYGVTPNEREGLLRLLKSLSFNEAAAQGNWDRTPRHFYTRDLLNFENAQEGKFSHASGAPLNLEELYGTIVPLIYGDDNEYCRLNPQNCNPDTQTLGLGIWQITPELNQILRSLNGQINTYASCIYSQTIGLFPGELIWVGNPGGCEREIFDPFRISDGSTHGAVQIRLDIDRWLHDPFYNLTKSVDLIRFKQVMYSDPSYQYGPLPGIKMSPQNLYDWSQIGNQIETINGENGWVPIFHGMVPYQQEPSDASDASRLAYLIENNTVVRPVHRGPWSLTVEKVLSQQQFVSESPQTYSALDTMLIIDSSGSMATTDPDDQRLNAASVYVDVSPAEDLVGVIDFEASPSVIQPFTRLGELNSDERTSVQNRIQAITTFGGTNIAASLALACSSMQASWQNDNEEQLQMVAAIGNLPAGNNTEISNERRALIPGIAHSVNSKKVAILLTDGDTAASYSSANQCFIDNGWLLYTIGFGGANGNRLSSLATATGGYYIAANNNLLDLTCAYQQIRSHASGEEPGACVSAEIEQDETIALNPVEVAANLAQITFTSTWPGSDIVMTLYTPSGRIISRDTQAADIFHVNTPTSELYTISTPEAGLWRIELYGADVPNGVEPVVIGTTAIPAPLNARPIAHSGGPYTAELGESLSLDASASIDPDGVLVNYQWDIGSDGTIEIATNNAVTTYLATKAFSDSLTLTVVDSSGYSASTTTTLNITEPSTPTISSLDPLAPACTIRSSQEVQERTLTVTGTHFPFPRSSQNLQFKRTDNGAQSIYLGMEVDWLSSTEITLDIARVNAHLWPDSPIVPLQLRLTDYDPSTGNQLPLTEWSGQQVLLANTASTCVGASIITSATPAPPACAIRNANNASKRTILLQGVDFPSPRSSQNLQFRRVDTGELSIHLGMEVDWRSDNEIALDIATVEPFLWPQDKRVPVQVRITDYDFNAGNQVPVSDWSQATVIIANKQKDCN